MASRLQWPFSMDVFYETHGLTDDVPHTPKAKSSQQTEQVRPRRSFHWPFSMEVFYDTNGLDNNLTKSIKQEKQKMLPESESEEEESLADRIIDSFVESCFDTITRSFAPAGSLKSLITPSTIAHELRLQTTPEAAEDARLIEYIYSKAIQIFATVIFVEPGNKARKTMLLCLDHNITDQDLPFIPASTGDVWVPARSAWSKSYNLKFCEAQWRFTAPVFSDMVEFLRFAPECILPVTGKGTATSGAFSNVVQAFIHEGHLQRNRAPGSESYCVAIKMTRS